MSAAIPVVILFMAVLSVPLAAAVKLGLSDRETASWIFVAWGLPGLLTIPLAIRFRQPLVLTANIFALILVSSLADTLSYPEIVGAFVIAGAGVSLIGVLGISLKIGAWIPAPVVLGLLAGATMPFVSGIFTSFGASPVLIGAMFGAYIAGRRFLSPRIPPILPALVVGIVAGALTNQFGMLPAGTVVAFPSITVPTFSVESVVTTVPVLIVLITLQSNLPSSVLLGSEGYRPPIRLINGGGGLAMIAGSFLGPTAVSLSLPVTSLIAGERAGIPTLRYRAALVAAAGTIVLSLLSGVASRLPSMIPISFLFALAGLALIDVLISALQRITSGPLLYGPVVAFAVALSDISVLGFGSFFWAIVLGSAVSLTLESAGMRRLRSENSNVAIQPERETST